MGRCRVCACPLEPKQKCSLCRSARIEQLARRPPPSLREPSIQQFSHARSPQPLPPLYGSIHCSACFSLNTVHRFDGGTLSGRKVYQCNDCHQYFYVYYPII